jgi:hypothetical protein
METNQMNNLYYVITIFFTNRTCSFITFSGKSKPSLSTILFGDTGCQLTCNLVSQLYGSAVRPITRNSIYCDCNEVFTVNGRQVDAEKFKSLPFNTLWNYWFEKTPTSNSMRSRIQRNRKMQDFVLPLMRNPHLTGSEIKQLILDEYPQLNQIQSVQAILHGKREDATKSAFEMDYDNLDLLFPTLFSNARSQVVGTAYQTTLYNSLNKLSKDDLEYVKNEVQKTGKNALIQIVNNYANANEERLPLRGRRRMPVSCHGFCQLRRCQYRPIGFFPYTWSHTKKYLANFYRSELLILQLLISEIDRTDLPIRSQESSDV